MALPKSWEYEDFGIQAIPRVRGVKFSEGAKHTKLYFNGKQSLLPRHAKELGEGLRKAILRQLDIKD